MYRKKYKIELDNKPQQEYNIDKLKETKGDRTMTVKELIERLSQYEEDTEVVIETTTFLDPILWVDKDDYVVVLGHLA